MSTHALRSIIKSALTLKPSREATVQLKTLTELSQEQATLVVAAIDAGRGISID